MESKRGNILIIVLAVLLLISTSAAGYFFWKSQQQPSPSPITVSTNCTSDDHCQTGYKCESIEGQGVTCPAGQTTINKDGTTTFTPYKGDCQPSWKIVKGVCKLAEGQTCGLDSDCYSGLICHSSSQGLQTTKKCTPPSLGDCSPDGKRCPAGYTCVQKCGPPVSRGEETPPGYFCEVNELAGKPRNCPICLASSSMIDTPHGQINVKELSVGSIVWTKDSMGNKVEGPVVRISETKVPAGHQVVHLVLEDSRELWASPGHPTSDGHYMSDLRQGDKYDGSSVKSVELIAYSDEFTYDLLPSGDTGFYWANRILVGSTLK